MTGRPQASLRRLRARFLGASDGVWLCVRPELSTGRLHAPFVSIADGAA